MAQGTRAHVIVLGNSKGGSGKSTTAMHIITRLLNMGFAVAALDIDGRQSTLGRYIENRHLFCEERGITLPTPTLKILVDSPQGTIKDAYDDDHARFCAALEELIHTHHFVVIDCPGNDSFMSRVAHSCADTLITPLNDSFVDVDVLARVDPNTYAVLAPSWYSEMVWEQRKKRYLKDQQSIDWVVVRNRVSHIDARNKRHVQQVLDALAPRIGFRHAAGLGERVIFRELFLRGLTLSDLKTKGLGLEITMAHVAANQEVRDLIHALRLPRLRDAQPIAS